MKIVKKIIFIIITIILCLVLAFNLYNFISLKILKKDLPTIGGYAVLEVATGSMEPTLKVGDLIIINTKEKNYQSKDIITFYDVNGSFVTHRLVSIKGDKMITKGDANNTEDEELTSKNIVGKYIFKIAGLGILLKSLRSPFTSIMILIIGILICWLVSTDKNGELILDEEEKEFEKFLELKEEQNSSPKKDKENILTKLKNKFKKKKKVSKKSKIKNKKKK